MAGWEVFSGSMRRGQSPGAGWTFCGWTEGSLRRSEQALPSCSPATRSVTPASGWVSKAGQRRSLGAVTLGSCLRGVQAAAFPAQDVGCPCLGPGHPRAAPEHAACQIPGDPWGGQGFRHVAEPLLAPGRQGMLGGGRQALLTTSPNSSQPPGQAVGVCRQ